MLTPFQKFDISQLVLFLIELLATIWPNLINFGQVIGSEILIISASHMREAYWWNYFSWRIYIPWEYKSNGH